jgi:hypothetical protein
MWLKERHSNFCVLYRVQHADLVVVIISSLRTTLGAVAVAPLNKLQPFYPEPHPFNIHGHLQVTFGGKFCVETAQFNDRKINDSCTSMDSSPRL